MTQEVAIGEFARLCHLSAKTLRYYHDIGLLGCHVAEHDVGLARPIVEVYLVGPDHTNDPNQYQTEICWPIQ